MGTPSSGRSQQGEQLAQKEDQFARLVSKGDKEEFFNQVVPLLEPLTNYVKRRLKEAYLTMRIRTPVYSAADIVDQAVLQAFEHYPRKPKDLTLEQWLYRLTNKNLEQYLRRRSSIDARRRSLETLNQNELRTMEEIPFTADADGEIWLPEELDDSEIQLRDPNSPSDSTTPEEALEKKEEALQILQALAQMPEREHLLFELSVIEGFSTEELARMYGMTPEEVSRIVQSVRTRLRQQILAGRKVRENRLKNAS
jgi:RNA polymerase sigma factor (sigma-70 family)